MMIKKKKTTGQAKFFNKVSTIERFLETSKLKYLSKLLHIHKLSSISKLLIYLGLIGSILFVISIIFYNFWIFLWFYTFLLIILSGFIAAKPGTRYNFILVLGIFTFLAFVPSIYGQSMLGMLSPSQLDITEADLVTLEKDIKPHFEPPYTIMDLEDYLDAGMTYDENKKQILGLFKANLTDEIKNKIKKYCDGYVEFNSGLTETWDPSGFQAVLTKVSNNPFQDWVGYVNNLIDVLNWVVFIAIMFTGAAAVGNVVTINFAKAIEKGAFIAISITIMTFIYAMFQSIDIPVRTVWDTIGNAWNEMLKKVGLATLDQNANWVITGESVGFGLYSWIPLIIILSCFGLALAFRKIDFESMLFAKSVLEKDTIEVAEAKFSVSIGILLFGMSLYLVGYFLITADPELVVNPYITLAFYLFAVVTLILIGFKFLILNKERSIRSHIWQTVRWTLFGLTVLFLWFQVFQPAAYRMNLIDTETSLLTLSQGQSFFEIDLLEQFFLVAMPETLIFQVFAVGLGNRVYFYLKKTRLSKKEMKRLRAKRWELVIQSKNISLNKSLSKDNLKNMVKLAAIKQKYDALTIEYEKKKVSKLPVSYFVISTLVSALVGSFFFSWYHSFRRGIDFVTWWQNPLYGMVYFGAGFFLCLISFICFPAAILVHALNNLIAIWMTGG
ncbi:MAG: hypothetical protein ACTSRI_02680 [Promethearchaeota archaeon]